MKRIRPPVPVLIGLLAGLVTLPSLQACQSRADAARPGAPPDAEVEAEVSEVIRHVYDLYTSGDLGWVDYYADEYTTLTSDGRAVTQYADSLRAQWVRMYDEFDVTVTARGEPTVLASGDRALHYNVVGETFVDRATGDTTRAGSGMWMAAWKKQPDGSWKIVLETYHVAP